MSLHDHYLPSYKLAQVVAEGLPVVGQYPILKNSYAINTCISSTRIALEVCKHYGVPARAVACDVTIWNRALIERVGRENRLPNDREEVLRWMHEDGSFARGIGVSDVPVDEQSWPGHCVLIVNNEWCVDMTLDQGCDPQHGINVEPITFPAKYIRGFEDTEPQLLQHQESGVALIYTLRPNKPPFDTSEAWRDTRAFGFIVPEIIDALDALDPQTVIRSSVWTEA